MRTVLAYDLGASSGRLVAQHFDGEKLISKEIHRFSNNPIHVNDHYYWDYTKLLKNIKEGIAKVDFPAESIGVDTWGVDFGLLNDHNELLSLPYSYRDTHSEKQVREVNKKISNYELFKKTGNEVSSINTLFQLKALEESSYELIEQCTNILMMPNLILHSLSGEKVNEFSISSTSQLVDRETKDWDIELQQLIFGRQLPFAQIELPHQQIGKLLENPTVSLALVPGHDTACALSALPVRKNQAIFISLGTWGLVGKEVEKAIISENAFIEGFTNEGTSEGTFRFQKNAMGFWILQKLREEWKAEGIKITHEMEERAFKEAVGFKCLIDPEHPLFFNPSSMKEAIAEYCKMNNQPTPTTVGEYLRCFIESLALSYAMIISKIKKITNQQITEVYICGGGANHKILCQLIANATGLIVKTGPVEASSIGNGLSQLRALKEISSVEEGRMLVEISFQLDEYIPQDILNWKEMNDQYIEIIGGVKNGTK